MAAIVAATGACAAPDAPGGAGNDPDVTGISLSLTITQTDAKCYRATFTSGATTVVQTFQPAAGSTAPVALTGLPVGTFQLVVDAFNVACASVVATTPITWTSSPVSVVLTLGVLTPVTVVLKRPAATEVTVDFDTSVAVAVGPAGSTIHDLAVFEPSVYIGRPTQIDRVPTTGGGVDVFATSIGDLNRVQADATGVYFSDAGSNPGTYFVPPDQLQKLISTKTPVFMLAVPGGLAIASSGTPGLLERVGQNGASTTLATNFTTAGSLATDGTANLYMVSALAASQELRRSPLSGGSQTTIASIGTAGGSLGDVAADSGFVYFTYYGAPGSGNQSAIYRIPVGTVMSSSVATISAGRPQRVLVDATNVYYLVRLTDNVGSCRGSVINKVPKAGGAVTPLWSRMGVCPVYLTQGTTALFFDAGADVRRVDK